MISVFSFLKVDIITPNLSELSVMASACLQDSDLRHNNIPTVLATAAIEHLGRVTKTGDVTLWGSIDAKLSTFADVAVLAGVLLRCMYGGAFRRPMYERRR